MKVSVVIPCYHSQDSLRDVVMETISALNLRAEVDYEIILVNDGSKDHTLDVIRQLGKNFKVRGVSLAKNFGQANATLAGLAYARGDLVVYSDDDGQTPILEIWSLIDKLQGGYDAVFASYARVKGAWIQRLGSKINKSMGSYLLGKPRDINLGNFWVARRFVIEEILKGASPNPYIGGQILRVTDKIGDFQTGHRMRRMGKSTYTFSKRVLLWLNGFTSFSVAPLRLGALTGVIIALIGLVLVALALVNWLTQPDLPPGYTSVFSAVMILGGMNLTLISLIGEYLSRIYLTVAGVPKYVVQELINIQDI